MILLQIPPTPTPIPQQPAPPINIPDVSLWNYADEMIQTWNSASQVTVTFQAIILLGVIMFILMQLYRYAKIISVVRND